MFVIWKSNVLFLMLLIFPTYFINDGTAAESNEVDGAREDQCLSTQITTFTSNLKWLESASAETYSFSDILEQNSESTTESSRAFRAYYSDVNYEKKCGDSKITVTRIVGGQQANYGEFPWQISLQVNKEGKWYHICGGSIIKSNLVSTAAHCTQKYDLGKMRVVSGDYNKNVRDGNEQYSNVIEAYYGDYNPTLWHNDIVLLRINPAINFQSKYVAPICIPRSNIKYESGTVVASGWGILKEGGQAPEILQKTSMRIVNRSECNKTYSGSEHMANCQMCTGGDGVTDVCKGDSGGPVIYKMNDGLWYLAGIVSFGYGCAQKGKPSVQTYVPCFGNSIAQVANN